MMSAREAQPVLSAESFVAIRGLVRSFAGMQLSDDARSTIERRLDERLEALDLDNFEEYVRYLRQHIRGVSELELAVELLATNETYFFRELPQLRAFEHRVLPQLRELGEVRKSLSIWSAGCSSGEEVYTLAILIAASELFTGFTVRVLGSDISRRVLQVARKGVYRDSSFRAMPSQYARHFSSDEEGMTVSSTIRAVCHFAHLNLLDDSRAVLIGRVDAIFCRNVLIYLDLETRQKVVRIFYDRLHPGGFLMLGHSESLLHMHTDFETVQVDGVLAYRKPLGASALEARR
jgi:chemotaxis protein methyltransferase CheR